MLRSFVGVTTTAMLCLFAGCAERRETEPVEPTENIGTTHGALSTNERGHWQPGPGASPPARGYHAMAYDAARKKLVLFGGWDGADVITDETWTYDGTTWTKESPAHVPPARGEQAMAYDAKNGEVVMFGGNVSPGVDLNDTWVWNGTDWTDKKPVDAPSNRSWVRMAWDDENQNLVLYGGSIPKGNTEPSIHYDDTWTWNGTNWKLESPAANPGTRSAHAMVWDPIRKRVVLFGGNNDVAFKNDVHAWNGTTWEPIATSAGPGVRSYHSMAFDPTSSSILIYGGGPSVAAGDDFWSLAGATWTKMPLSAGTSAPAQRAFGTIGFHADSKRVVLMGGVSSLTGAYLADAWTHHTHGASCTLASDCATGNCVDGVCCDTACNGACQTCNATGFEGTCSGDVTESCRVGSCTNGIATAPASCTAQGTCPAAVQTSCAPYACGAGACKTTCSTSVDCITGYECKTGSCVPIVDASAPEAGPTVPEAGSPTPAPTSTGTNTPSTPPGTGSEAGTDDDNGDAATANDGGGCSTSPRAGADQNSFVSFLMTPPVVYIARSIFSCHL